MLDASSEGVVSGESRTASVAMSCFRTRYIDVVVSHIRLLFTWVAGLAIVVYPYDDEDFCRAKYRDQPSLPSIVEPLEPAVADSIATKSLQAAHSQRGPRKDMLLILEIAREEEPQLNPRAK